MNIFCGLCLQNNLLNYFSVCECNYENINAIFLIEKHFQLQIEQNNFICLECWKNVESFHAFYIKVKEVHRKLLDKIATVDYSLEHIDENINDNENSGIKDEKWKEVKLEIHDENSNDIEDNVFHEFHESSNEMKYVDENVKKITFDNILNESDEKIIIPTKTRQKYTKATKDTALSLEIAQLLPEDLKKGSEKYDEIDKRLDKYIDYTCPNCSDILPSFRKLIRHGFNSHKIKGYALCCNVKLFNRNLAMEHIDRYHSDENIDNYKCTDCGKQLANTQCLNNHKIVKHKLNKNDLYPCDLCSNVSFSTADKLKKHQRGVHTEKKLYKCTECSKIFGERVKLKNHFIRVHSTPGIVHICDICGAAFKTKYGFKNHHKEIHLAIDKPKKKCNICGNIVKSLKKHRYMTHPSDDVVIKCDICNKVVCSWKALYNHKQNAHREKKFKCDICEKAFKELKLLREHVATHTGQPLYQCAYCPTTFKSEANYFKHRKRLHNQEWLDGKKSKIYLN